MKTIITFDASQFATYMTCPTLLNYKYRENLRPAQENREAMDKGTLVHSLLDNYYRLVAQDPGNNLSHMEHAWNTFEESNQTESLGIPKAFNTFLRKRFIDYIMHYNGRDFHPIVKNGTVSVELGFSKILLETELYMFIVEGRIDLIEYKDKLIWWDHKSQDVFSNLYNYTPQFLTYAWATGYEYGGINYFGLQKEVNDNTFRRNLIHFPKFMLKRWEQKMISILMDVSVDLSENKFEMNFNSCGGPMNKRPCAFTHLCETESDEMRENIKKFRYKEVEPWHPW